MYLFFPTTSDATFPNYNGNLNAGSSTSPLSAFDVADLASGIGTTTQLRDRIHEIVTDDYCEFNVNVNKSTAVPAPSETRWQVVGIGSDSANGGNLFGLAQAVDTNDADDHILATGSTGLTGEIRASRDRHFSDTEYEILGHNVGLNIKTLHNWDFVNPNDTSANAMRIKLLSTASSLTVGWSYNGSRSPWQNPTVTSTGTTESFQGTTFNIFNLDFTSAKSWDGPTAGVVDAGAEFHTGASFTGGTSVIVSRVQLLNAGTALPLAPRLPGYDAGTADLGTGDFAVNFFNTDPSAGDLEIRNLQLRFLPRMLDINSMVSDGRLVDVSGVPFEDISSRDARTLNLKDRAELFLGKLTDKRSVDIRYTEKDCPPGSTGSGESPQPNSPNVRNTAPGDTNTGEESYCLKGNALSLFPSTYTYITATVVEPNVKHFDKAQGQFVTGPLETKLFYQVGGIVPDFDENGIDDLIDIRTGKAKDKDENGVIDDVEPTSPPGFDWLWLILLLILILLSVLFLVWRRKP